LVVVDTELNELETQKSGTKTIHGGS